MTWFHSPSAAEVAKRLKEYDHTCCFAVVVYQSGVEYLGNSLLPDKSMVNVQSRMPESLQRSSKAGYNVHFFWHCSSLNLLSQPAITFSSREPPVSSSRRDLCPRKRRRYPREKWNGIFRLNWTNQEEWLLPFFIPFLIRYISEDM